MASTQTILRTVMCDGCGLGATSEHIARRLARLQQTTRFRPIHMQTVFLGGQSPAGVEEFLYGSEREFRGEAAELLSALQIDRNGRSVEAVLAEFQKKGWFLTHVLECAPESDRQGSEMDATLAKRLPSVIRKIRGSLRPKRVALISKAMLPLVNELKTAQIGCELLVDGDAPYDLADAASSERLSLALRGL